MQQIHLHEELDLDYSRASTGKRFANYLIDALLFYVVAFLLGIVVGFFKPELLPDEDSGILSRIVSLICYGMLMFIIEAACGGKTLGKVITGTKAINSDGSEMSFQKAFIRNIIRCIPFNALSAFGTPCNPWHDAWSNTMVIDEKKLDLQLRKDVFFSELSNQNGAADMASQ
ncbi:RDD family protein [Pedobacter helvus]|uniref:RDD family protein n=1 Tax=Pedobacter helvus TaxID=2563444 RepID=A0ABW9JKG2_9SPHI|nr:RDD family protein [Pedobacter ureilyticus]